MKAKIKSKVKAKAAAVKAKAKGIKAKVKGKCKACAALVAALCAAVLLGGCAEARPASRATTATYDITVKICMDEAVKSPTVNIPFTFGDGAIASADSAGSTETQTATPTTDVKPDVNVDVPVTKGAAANAAADLLGAAASALKGTGSADCAGGSCTDGSCEYTP